MSNIKDNNLYPDNKGHSVSGEVLGMKNNNIQKTDLIVRKAERLTTALYMVSDIIGDREPIKWKMRETSVEMLSDTTLSGTASSSERISYLRNVMKRIEKLVSFIDIASTTRMISEMNAGLLRKEYLALRSLIEDEIVHMLDGSSFRPVTPPMYRVETREQPKAPVQPAVDTSRENLEKEVAAVPHRPQQEVDRRVGITDRPTVGALRTESTSHRPVSEKKEGGETDNRVAKDDRRKIILALLKQKPALTVKDIGISIPGFSEKTIQRELVAMLDEHLLVKQGEKRWTTYSLAQGQ